MPLTDGLLHRWENYPNAVADWTATFGGVNLSLSPIGTVGTATGKVGHNVPEFFADGAYLSSTSIAVPSTFMLSLWVWFDTLTTHRMLVAKDDVGSNREFTLDYNSASARLELVCMGGGFDVASAAYSTTAAWTFITAWRNATEVGIRLNNGTKVTTALTTTPASGSAPFAVGDRPASSLPHDGRIGPLMLHSRVLTDTEQDQLYNLGAGIKFGGGAVGGRVVTTPRVGGRVITTPRVGGRVVTTPRVGGRVVTEPR